MRRTSRRGKADAGYAFLDVVVAMFVITLGLAGVLAGLATASRAVARQRARIHARIEERNAAAGFAATENQSASRRATAPASSGGRGR
jgi:Tfp pilus assembly protein PilV